VAENDASIRIKLGQLEVEYQGDASFLKEDLLETVKQLLELQKENLIVQQIASGADNGAGGTATFDHSTDSIANILGAKSGTLLALAAAAHLHFVKGKQKFTRQEIIAEMRTAPGHWKNSYSNNMSAYLNGLKGSKDSKDRLRLVSDDTYALSSKEKQALEAKLAEDQ
jgi:hypothetical protein